MWTLFLPVILNCITAVIIWCAGRRADASHNACLYTDSLFLNAIWPSLCPCTIINPILLTYFSQNFVSQYCLLVTLIYSLPAKIWIYYATSLMKIWEMYRKGYSAINCLLNVLKTHYTVFTPRNKPIDDTDVNILDVQIQRVYATIFVGGQIDSQLT